MNFLWTILYKVDWSHNFFLNLTFSRYSSNRKLQYFEIAKTKNVKYKKNTRRNSRKGYE